MSRTSLALVMRSSLTLLGCATGGRPLRHLRCILAGMLLCAGAARGDGEAVCRSDVTSAAKRALALLETASAGSAERRTCFTCHSQALPVLTLVEARDRGLSINAANLDRQVLHTAQHLKRGRDDYLAGHGQGGKSDTAGYALWTLQSAGFRDSEIIDPVVAWLMDQQQDAGYWKRSGDRPPSEASHFSTTYVALRAVKAFASPEQRSRTAAGYERARNWLVDAGVTDTEDRVFRLLALHLVEASDAVITTAANELIDAQRCDGGWGQTQTMASDAYATGTALFALHQTQRLAIDDPAYVRGLRYLLETQHEDGSWHVASRSRPFQTHYETGFPHGKDQFISTSATAWATRAMLSAMPSRAADPR